jgi:hypothetical protein
MSGSVSLAPTNDRHDADRLHPLHRTESDRDLAYLIRTSLRFSAQQERGAQLADFIGDSQSREARICSVRSDSSSGGLPSSDRLPTSSRRIRAACRGCGDRGRFASKLLACPASQTASQSMRQLAIIWGHPLTLLTATAALPGVPAITDTEEATGSKSSIAHPA